MLVTCVGIAVVDIVSAGLPNIASPGEVVFAPKGTRAHLGGHAITIPINLVQLGMNGSDITSIFAIGNDMFGNFLVEGLLKYGVVAKIVRSMRSTSSNLILVVQHEDRRFHVDVGANIDMDPYFVINALEEEKPNLLYTGAIGWLGKFDEELPSVYKKAKAQNTITLASIITPYGKGWDFIVPSLQYIDIFHCNDVEASRITKERDPMKAIDIISGEGVNICIISMGEKGACIKVFDHTMIFPSFKINSVDPTGAGDAFCSGTIYKLTNPPYKNIMGISNDLRKLTLEDWEDIFMYASACGAACCTSTGTTTAVKPEIINKIILEQGKRFMKNIKVL